MSALTNEISLDSVEGRIKSAYRPLLFTRLFQDMKELEKRLEDRPEYDYDRARFHFLKGALYTKAVLLNISYGSASESLVYATGQFADCIRTLDLLMNHLKERSAEEPAEPDVSLIAQMRLLRAHCTYEWAVAYTTLLSWGEAGHRDVEVLGSDCLGPDSKRRVQDGIRRRQRIKSRFYDHP